MIGALDGLRDELRHQIEALAESLLGEPNKALSNRRNLRFGNKGSLSVAITGRKHGAWFDHEAGEGGGPLDLVRHVKRCDWADAIAWARSWAGQDARTRPEFQHTYAPERDNSDAEGKAGTAEARRWWMQAKPIAGTLGEKYLVETRKIPVPAGGWPYLVVRYLASKRSIILAATLPDGTVQAVQRIRLGRDGRKADDGWPSKPSRGPQAGALVRLPGDRVGPLLLAEGPETGLSVWQATGFETWITLGSMAKAELPKGRRIVICADDDRRRADAGNDANAHMRLTEAVATWKRAGLNVTVTYPWVKRQQDKSDFNDLIQANGVEAVAGRIEAALNPPASTVTRVPVAEARAKLAEAVEGFLARALACMPPEKGQPAIKLPSVEAIRVDVGAGKSDAARRGLVRQMAELRAAGDQRNAVILVPTHALGDEQVAQIKALPKAKGLQVRVWRGRKALDPDAPDKAMMCRDTGAVDLAQSVGLDPQEEVCRRKLADGTVVSCPFFEGCGYQRQRMAKADIWLAAHELLFTEKPRTMGELAAVVVDESFWQAGLRARAEFPLDLLETAEATVPDDPLGTDRLTFLRRRALDALRKHADGPVLRDSLLAAEFTHDNATEAYALEGRRKIEGNMVPGMSPAARKEAAAAALSNQRIMRLAAFWQTLKALVTDGGPEASGWLALDHNGDGARVVTLKGRREVTTGWSVPTLILDAILRPELVRPFYPQMQMVADLAVTTPHQWVRQVVDRAYSKAMLAPLDLGEAKPEEVSRRARNLVDLRVRLILEARRVAPGRVLVVLQKAVEEGLHALGPLPPNVETGHHNAIAGRDEWRDVALLVVVGRTMPPPKAVTSDAEAISGSAVPLLTGWYDRTDAIRETMSGAELAEADRHPDPLAEAIRWQICEGELVQIIGRGRGVNRTAADPLDVLVLCDVPLPLPVAETLPAAALDISIADHMQALGGVTFENAGHAYRAYPGLWPSDRAAAKAIERERTATNPYKDSLIGECRTPLVRVTYQVAGPGQKPAVAWCNLMVVPDPAAWLAAKLGHLVSCAEMQPDPPAMELVQLPVAEERSGLVPELVYPRSVLELPPANLLVVRGRAGRAVAMIEAPAIGPIMGARAVMPGGLGPWLLLNRPPPADPLVTISHPAFLPNKGGEPRPWT